MISETGTGVSSEIMDHRKNVWEKLFKKSYSFQKYKAQIATVSNMYTYWIYF